MTETSNLEKVISVIIIFVLSFLILGWTCVAFVFPILGIWESIKMTLEARYDITWIIAGISGTVGTISVVCYFIYNYILSKINEKSKRKQTRKKLLGILAVFSVLLLVIFAYYYIVSTEIILPIVSTFLFIIEIVLFNILLLIETKSYSKRKVEKML